MSEIKMTACKWCKAEMPDDPGAYYHKKRCHALDVADRIVAARKRGASEGELRDLDLELQFAEYVGD